MSDSLSSILAEVQAVQTAHDSKVTSVSAKLAEIETSIAEAEAEAEAAEDGSAYVTAEKTLLDLRTQKKFYQDLSNSLENDPLYTEDEARAIGARAQAVISALDSSRKSTLASTKCSGLSALVSGWKENDNADLSAIHNRLLYMSGCNIPLFQSRVLGIAEAMLNRYKSIV